jgi:hypothetical protein
LILFDAERLINRRICVMLNQDISWITKEIISKALCQSNKNDKWGIKGPNHLHIHELSQKHRLMRDHNDQDCGRGIRVFLKSTIPLCSITQTRDNWRLLKVMQKVHTGCIWGRSSNLVKTHCGNSDSFTQRLM